MFLKLSRLVAICIIVSEVVKFTQNSTSKFNETHIMLVT